MRPDVAVIDQKFMDSALVQSVIVQQAASCMQRAACSVQHGPGMSLCVQYTSHAGRDTTTGQGKPCNLTCSMHRSQPVTAAQADVPKILAMTVVTSKLQASAAIMTPPGRPNTRKLEST